MIRPFFYGSPRQRRIGSPETVAEETDRFVDHIKAANAGLIADFRAGLPPHRRGWFDSLPPQDQFMVARPVSRHKGGFQ